MMLREQLRKEGDFLFKYRSNLPLLIILIGIIVFVVQVNNDELRFSEKLGSATWEYICFLVGLLGFFIRVHVVGYTPPRTSGRNTSEGQIADVLNTTGLYSCIRHPLYLGNFFMWLGVAMLTENVWFIVSFILFYIIYYMRIMYAEEAFLFDKFGKMYEDWSSQTNTIIPNFSQYKGANMKFQLKKVIKKEKNGILALFILFWVFERIESFLKLETFELEYSVWFIGMVVTIAYYLIVKILRKSGLL